MERLTECVGFQNGNPIYKTNIDMRRIGSVDKLKNALGRYEDAEEEGLLLRLPCKPGTAVYKIEDDCTYGDDCHMKKMCDICEYRDLHVEREILATEADIVLNMQEFGETIFLSEKEANEALEKVKLS